MGKVYELIAKKYTWAWPRYDNVPDYMDGWYDILRELLEALDAFRPEVNQIKEKFGGLRFYVSYGDNITAAQAEFIDLLIETAEEESLKTCMVCGRPGELTTIRGWFKPLCKKHTKEAQDAVVK